MANTKLRHSVGGGAAYAGREVMRPIKLGSTKAPAQKSTKARKDRKVSFRKQRTGYRKAKKGAFGM